MGHPSLILHELATNAVKHGSLSVPSGRVRVRWEVGEASASHLRLVWQETGGPPVAAPASLVFGTNLVEFAASHELGGQVELNYASAGWRRSSPR